MAWVQLSNRRVVPFFDGAQVDVTQGFAVQNQLARLEARQVNRQHYQKETGNKVNYQGIGSSGGVKQIIANTVDFGASDKEVPEPSARRTTAMF